MLLESEWFLRARGQTKSMGPTFWEHLSHEPRGAIAVPFARHALLKCALSGVHEIYVTDIKKVWGKDALEHCKTANSLLKKFREKMNAVDLDPLDNPDVLHIET